MSGMVVSATPRAQQIADAARPASLASREENFMSVDDSSRRRLQVAVAVAVFIGGSALALSAQADPLTVSRSVSPEQQTAASAYWTRDRIAAAPPMRLPVDYGHGDLGAVDEPAVAGPVGMTEAGMPAPNASRVARAAFPRDWDAVDAGALEQGAAPQDGALDEPADTPTGTAGIFTSYDVNTVAALWQVFPHRWSGRLTFTTPSGGASCSATVINGNNIVTAAHCMYDTTANKWYSNWVFTPGAPYGTFPAKVCSVLTAWVNLTGSFQINTWSRHDVAVCTLNKNGAGQTINGAVGWAGRLWNAGNAQLVFNNGYPARDTSDNLITNGPAQYLRSCTAETFLQTTETLGSGCRWGRGISGGGWLVNYRPFVVSGNVNSVNSGIFIGQQNNYGARFNSSNIVPLCTARGC
jgi:V8-like Glu-specific endopeptidase